METSPNNKIPPDRERDNPLIIEPSTNMSAAAVTTLPSGNNQLVLYTNRPTVSVSSISSVASTISMPSNAASSTSSVSAPIEKLSRPMAFDKMEALVKEMQDLESGVPVRSQKIFLTSIPSAFMGYDLIEWLMERLNVEESEALNMANQLCQHGYFFPVSDSKTLVVKDDSSLYRFQSPYYWPWRQQKAPDQIEYAIYLAKRSLRNKQRHGLEEYETEALASLHKNLKGKWDFITMQAEEQIKLAKDRKKGDKIVSDSQERAYWRVHRPPPGQFTPLEPCPIPSRDRQGKPRKRTEEDWKREVEITRTSMGRNRMKMSAACESLVTYFETFTEYDPLMQPALPSNPWVTEDITFWQLNSAMVDIPTEKRVKRWSISIEELVKDPTGLQEFTTYLRKEYSHENIRFWSAVNDMRRSSQSHIPRKAREIYEEFLEPGAPCEINIDGKTMEKVQQALKAPSRFTFDIAAEHVYTLLLKKDCYPRFIRSEHYKNLLANAIQPSQKKRFFGFGGPAKKKPSTTTAPNQALLTQMPGTSTNSSLTRRRGSDRSLSGSAHELAVCGVNKDPTKVPHSHSQSNLSEIPYRTMIYRGDMPQSGNIRLAEGYQEPTKQLETTFENAGPTTCSVCPWDIIENDPPSSSNLMPPPSPSLASKPRLTIDLPLPTTSSSDLINTDVSERMRRSCGLRQNTLDSDFHSTKRLAPIITEQRRASMTIPPKLSEMQFNITPPTVTTTAAPDDDNYVNESSCIFVINTNKADSIEEKDETSFKESSESLQESVHKSTFLSDDVLIEESAPIVPNEAERKLSIIVSERKESLEAFEIRPQEQLLDVPPEAMHSIPSSISTQTLPTEEFPEASFNTTLINQADNISTDELNPSDAERKSPTLQEIETVSIREMSSRSIEEKDVEATGVINSEETVKLGSLTSRPSSYIEQQQQQQKHFLANQQSMSQDDDFEVAMVSGLLPGCVAPAPTPAPSIAPLAEIDDPGEDEIEMPAEQFENVEHKPEIERKKKRREKREKESGGGTTSHSQTTESGAVSNDPEKSKHNAVCPWEDEDVTTAVEAPFVKTYATLGYL